VVQLLNQVWRLPVAATLLLFFLVSLFGNEMYVFDISADGAITVEQQHYGVDGAQRDGDTPSGNSDHINLGYINVADGNPQLFDSSGPLPSLQIPPIFSHQFHSVVTIFPGNNSTLLQGPGRSLISLQFTVLLV
jgi:hypothetical protein